MTTTTDALWVSTTDYPVDPRPQDLQEFFGIPPDPPEALDGNIREKRKHWKKKQSKARSDEALGFAEAVLQAIAEAEDALKRGAEVHGATTGPLGASGPARRAAATVDDVWRELERLLFRGRYREALDRMVAYEPRWGTHPAFIDIRAAVILDVVQNAPEHKVATGLLWSAIEGARQALQTMGPSEARYVTLIELLEAAGDVAGAARATNEAIAAVPAASLTFRLKQFARTLAERSWPEVLRLATAMDAQGGDADRTLRSELVQLLMAKAGAELLPICSGDDLAEYRRVVATAAWIAQGVPEAEDFVRFHRMWATNADQKVFAGNWQWRALFGILTAFVGLPLLNLMAGKPAWRVVLDGPPAGDSRMSRRRLISRNRSWFLVTRNAYLEIVHDDIRLPWQQRSGQWIELDPEPLFDF
jgi:hypothetical protein